MQILISQVADIQIDFAADTADFSVGSVLPQIISAGIGRGLGILCQPDLITAQSTCIHLGCQPCFVGIDTGSISCILDRVAECLADCGSGSGIDGIASSAAAFHIQEYRIRNLISADADKTEIQKLQATSGNAKVGIDVSKWNGIIDWDKVKNAGVQFAIVRAGYRGSVTGSLVEDPQFVANMKGAAAAGIPVGVYFFTQATDEKEAVEEASAVLELIRDFQLTYPVFIDTEGAGGNGRADGLNAETRTLVCEAFCRTVENAGYTAGVYASRNWYNNNLQTARLENYHIWLAEYRSVPLYQGYYKTWQYTSKGKVDGIEGRVDINITYE